MKTAAIALSSLIIIPSCSLQYAREENPESANPEFISRPMTPHPLFTAFVGAALKAAEEK